jgi:hypothetical protein
MTAPADGPGQRPDHRPRKGFWARFSDQETGPQKVLVGLAGTVTALATTVGGIYALTNVIGKDDSQTVATDRAGSTGTATPTSPASEPPTSGTPEPTAPATDDVPLKPGQTLVRQGSKEADALVHALVDEPGKRADIDVVILAESTDKAPQYIMRLWYDCQDLPAGEPPGADLCDAVTLVFDDAYPPGPVLFKRPLRVELRGTWFDHRPTGAGYGAEGLEIYPAPASS